MSKKIFFSLLFVLCLSFLYGDWMKDVSQYFNDEDHSAALDYLETMYPACDAAFKPTLSVLLAYSASQTKDVMAERKWIVEYFETYWAQNIIIHYLARKNREDLETYLNQWHQIYPQITDIYFLQPHDLRDQGLPVRLILGLDVKREGLFKLFRGDEMIKGSLLKKGLNSISIPSKGLFNKSGQYEYLLEFKVGNMILSKKIIFDVQVDEPQYIQEQKEDQEKFIYDLSLYVGGRLISSSRKEHVNEKPIDWGIDPDVPYKPVEAPKESNILPSSFSILAVIGLAAHIIKSLTKKDVTPPTPPPRQVRMMTLKYRKLNSGGVEQNINASIRMKYVTVGLRTFH